MIKNIFSDTVKYGLGKVVIKFFSILVVPIIAKKFPPDIFGEINLVSTFVGFFTGITVLGLDSSIGYYYYHGEEGLRKDYLGTAFIVRMITSAIIFLLFFSFARQLSGTDFLLKNSDRYLLVVLGAAAIPFDNCMSFFTDLTRFIIKPIIYNAINISKIIIYYGLVVIFLLTNLTAEKIFISLFLSSVIPSFFLFFYYKKHLKIAINPYCLKQLLEYGLPLVPTSIMFWFINSANRFVLNVYTGLEEIGVYSMMNTIAGIFLLITSSILAAWPPYAMIIAKRTDAQMMFSGITTLLLILLVPLAFFFWSIADVVIILFSKSIYLRGEKIVIFLVMQHILNLLYYCIAVGLTLTKKTVYITIGYFIAGVVTVAISFPLCKYFGILGAALSSFAGYLISILYIFFKSQKFYPVPYKVKSMLIYLFFLGLTLVAAVLFSTSNIFKNFISRFSIGCIFLILPFVIKLISFSDVRNFFKTGAAKT
ncbi:MAG: oligosaccharide flippase family protein [Bacteroidales bacterium]|jgi:O-antigen/teichoic acid export membrane protein|nr:oligosaccharide flippase family protein [Bacteroidales bacterium]